MKVADGTQMHAIDKMAIEKYGIPGIVLMENASKAVSLKCIEILNEIKGRTAVAVCGSGNNGGDGFAVARMLYCYGIKISVIFIGEEKKLTNDAKVNFESLKKIGIDICTDINCIEKCFNETDIIIDAIFGTGFKGKPRFPASKVIEMINSSGKKVISIDIPSGVDADNGHVDTVAVKADETVTFAYHKIGCILYPGAEYCGNITVANISIPNDVENMIEIKGNIAAPKDIWSLIPKRKARSNKGTYGKLFVIAGSEEMTGAGALCCKAAYKSGCGVVNACTLKKCADVMHILVPEAVVRILPGYDGKFFKDSFDVVSEDLRRADSVVIGPGIGKGKDVSEFTEKILLEAACNVLIDADGLNGIADSKSILKKMKKIPIITPHPMEFSRLTGLGINEILDNTVGEALKFAEKYNTVVLLKDARTVIASPWGDYYINMTGNNSLAKGGSGDVLSGIIGGFMAQGMEPYKAAVAGAYIHGTCGDLASEKLGMYGVDAGDIARYIPLAMNFIKDKAEKFE